MSSTNLQGDVVSEPQVIGSCAAEVMEAQATREILAHIVMGMLRELEDHALYRPNPYFQEDEDQRQQRHTLVEEIWDELMELVATKNTRSLELPFFDHDKQRHLRNAIDSQRVNKDWVQGFMLWMWVEARSKGKEEPAWYVKPPVLIVPGFTFRDAEFRQSRMNCLAWIQTARTSTSARKESSPK